MNCEFHYCPNCDRKFESQERLLGLLAAERAKSMELLALLKEHRPPFGCPANVEWMDRADAIIAKYTGADAEIKP